MKTKNTTKKFTFSAQERDTLKNIEIGLVNAKATLDGLNIYKDVLLNSVYKRIGIAGEAKKGFEKSISYNLGENVITYTEVPVNKDLLVKK